MKVGDIMTRRVISVRPEARVGEIARIFREHGISGLPVVDEEDGLIGIVTELDLVTRHARPQLPRFLPLLGAFVPLASNEYEEALRRITGVVAADIMTTPVKTINPEASLEDLATLMVGKRANPVPVVDSAGRLIGIVSRTDLLRVLEELEVALDEAQSDEGQSAAG